MANPVITAVPANAWTKVATNVLAGQIHRISNAPNVYLQTYRLTGGGAPTLKSEGVIAFQRGDITEQISASAAIDVYMWADGGGGAGSVRVDV